MSARLEVITGPMFSGKSEELIRLLKRVRYAKKKALVLKPAVDHRTDAEIASREVEGGKTTKMARFPALSIVTLEDFQSAIASHAFDVLAIDEAQFFTQPWFVPAIKKLLAGKAREDFRILVAGLDLTANLEPFGPMPELLAMADSVMKLTAVCFVCGAPAPFTQKKGGLHEQIQIGDLDLYEARCRKHHEPF